MSTLETIGAEWHIDAGHAWLAVNLRKYPSALEYGTGWGFIDTDNEVIYLEEDTEAQKFAVANAAVYIHSVSGRLTSNNHGKNAPCRSLPRNEARLALPAYKSPSYTG